MIDLHLHLDGSLPIRTVSKLAKIQRITLPESDDAQIKKLLSVNEKVQSLNDYLKCFDLPLSLLQSRESVELAVYELLEELAIQGLVYAEIRFAPQLHTKNGATQQEIIESAISGLVMAQNQFPIKSNLILCLMRGGSEEANRETVLLAEKYLGCGVCAIDLAGAEALYKTAIYKELFSFARSLGVPFTIHAGEADTAQSVRDAVSFGARRIGHGVAAVDDGELLCEMREKNISIECCLKSNLQTKAVAELINHPIKRFLEFGINATINTDNMTVSDTTIKNEITLFKAVMPEVSPQALLDNAINSAFLSQDERAELKRRLNPE